jgi:hypothetical protein
MKTPEELAKEWYSQMLKSGRDPLGDEGFLAGYKAAQEQFADVGKVMANTPEKPDGWISVKDRLPGPYEKVTTCWSGKDIYWMPLPEPPSDNG